jgi:hypothetical protein
MLQRLLGKNPDVFFAYQTERILIIRDLLLAIIGYVFTFAVLIYIVLYVFIILEKFNEKGIWSGYVFYTLTGKAYSSSNGIVSVWDYGDLLYPEQDSRGLLLGISVEEILGQTIGFCSLACTIDSDCPNSPPRSYGQCTDNGYCNAPSWCPVPSTNSSAYTRIRGVENFVLDIHAGITFPMLDSDDYISYDDDSVVKYPKDDPTQYLIGDILYEAGISSVDDIRSTGTIVEMHFDWDCDAADSSCMPDLKFDRRDEESMQTSFT